MVSHIVLVMHKDNNYLFWAVSLQAQKIKYIVLSTIVVETLALQEGLDDGFYLCQILIDILNMDDLLSLTAYVS
jgi:phosphorylcholine metabolism protein LicD